MDNLVLELQGVQKTYQSSNLPEVKVLKGVDLTIRQGEIVGLLAPSGAGKSTLIFVSGLIESPTEGEIFVCRNPAHKIDDAKRTRIRRDDIGIMYQFHHLLPEFSAVENISIPQMACGIDGGEAKLRARELLDSVGLMDRYEHKPSELSGGEQQRVSLCRSLANSPKLLLADEPTGNLDSRNSQEVFDLLLRKVKETTMGALVATHNLSLARQMDRIVYLKDGIITGTDTQ